MILCVIGQVKIVYTFFALTINTEVGFNFGFVCRYHFISYNRSIPLYHDISMLLSVQQAKITILIACINNTACFGPSHGPPTAIKHINTLVLERYLYLIIVRKNGRNV